jgi:ubiquinone/menaquinone biosynthesis C-methylase UbiE
VTLCKDPEGTEIRHLKQAADLAGKDVLEIGCGDGRLTWRYAHAARGIIGIDPDADALKTARTDRPASLHDTVSFAQASALALPFSPETFDLTILAWSF